MHIELKIIDKKFYEKYSLPEYQTPGSAALDLRVTKDVTLYPGERRMLPTGLAIWIGGYNNFLKKIRREEWVQSDYAGLILPRSGLGTKGLVLANTVGLIDSDFQGQLMISAWNNNPQIERFYNEETGGWMARENTGGIKLSAGDRIAQLMILPIIKCQWNIVEEFGDITDRGEGGWGHSGAE